MEFGGEPKAALSTFSLQKWGNYVLNMVYECTLENSMESDLAAQKCKFERDMLECSGVFAPRPSRRPS
jgi:hypothetical protein